MSKVGPRTKWQQFRQFFLVKDRGRENAKKAWRSQKEETSKEGEAPEIENVQPGLETWALAIEGQVLEKTMANRWSWRRIEAAAFESEDKSN